MKSASRLSDWDIEHGWYAVRLFEQKLSLPEIAFMMQADQKWIARYIAQILVDPDLKDDLMRRAACRWPREFEQATIAY